MTVLKQNFLWGAKVFLGFTLWHSMSAFAATSSVVTDITTIAKNSSCASYSWKDRGKAPSSYIQGMAVMYARSLCRYRNKENAGYIMAQKDRNNSTYDAVTWYESTFDAREMEIDSTSASTLRSVYTLLIGLGMRESSGKYCTGYDTSASTHTSTTAEAGLFQTSYSSVGASSELTNIMNNYNAKKSKCYLEVFSPGVTCKSQSIIGSGSGADFQKLAKSCPAFATEYAAITLRTLRKHYGPIIRKEAEVRSTCDDMLDSVQEYVESKASKVCSSL